MLALRAHYLLFQSDTTNTFPKKRTHELFFTVNKHTLQLIQHITHHIMLSVCTLLSCSLIAACHGTEHNDEAERADSIIAACTDLMFSAPAKADSTLAALQGTLTDSAS